MMLTKCPYEERRFVVAFSPCVNLNFVNFKVHFTSKCCVTLYNPLHLVVFFLTLLAPGDGVRGGGGGRVQFTTGV